MAMATILSSDMMNIVEAAKREHFTNEADFLSAFTEENDFLRVIPAEAANNETFDRFTRLVKAPKGGWGKINSGIRTSKANTDVVQVPLKLYDGMSQVDERLLLGVKGEVATKVRQTEDIAWLKGLNDDWLKQLLYSEDYVEGFPGLFTLRGTLNEGDYLTYDASGGKTTTGGYTSALLCEMGGEKGLSLLYRAGHSPVFSMEDRGRHLCDAPDGTGKMFAWCTYFSIMGALKIRQERAVMRIANIIPDSSDSMDAFAQKFIVAKNHLPSRGRNAVLFVNRAVSSVIDQIIYNKANMAFQRAAIESWGIVNTFLGIPILSLDAISEEEDLVESAS